MSVEITLSDSGLVTARRQIATQIAARILSGELGSGRRLPSGRALARRLRVHRSVVAGAYRQLSGWGLVRSAAGSGVFVTGASPLDPARAGSLRRFLEARRDQGNTLHDTADLLRRWMQAADQRRILLVEREAALRELLAAEIRQGVPGVTVRSMSLGRVVRDPLAASETLVVARRGLVAPLQSVLPPWVETLPIRFRPASGELLAARPGRAPCVVGLCTRSRIVAEFARGLLASTYGDRAGVLVVDPADSVAVSRARRISRWIFSDSACAPDLLRTLRPMRSGIARVRVVRLVSPRFTSALVRYFREPIESVQAERH